MPDIVLIAKHELHIYVLAPPGIKLTASRSSIKSESELTEAVERTDAASSAGSEAGMSCEAASPYRFFLAAVNCKRQISYFNKK